MGHKIGYTSLRDKNLKERYTMARPLRIEYENAVYHITARGNEGKNIFLDDEDYEKFLFYLNVVHNRYKVIVYCYVLMGNHYHLLIETPEGNLSKIMRDLNGHYTIYFNKRHKRQGHLFQGRYKAILVDKESYLIELSRYIHLNPVRAGICSQAEEYKYSSIIYYMNKSVTPLWLDVNFSLKLFGKDYKRQRESYKEFLYEGLRSGNPLENVYAQSILGTESFVEKIVNKFLKGRPISEEVPEHKKLKYYKDLEDISEVVARYYNIEKDELMKRKVKFNKGRKVFVYLARRYTSSSLKRIANFLRNSVGESGVSKMYSRVEEEMRRKKQFREEVEEIEKQIFEDDMSHVKT